MPMPRRASVALVVAPNGLGHARRGLAVLARLVEVWPEPLDVHVVAETWPRDRLAPWRALDVLAAADATWHDGVVAPGVAWSPDPTVYDDGRLLGWERRLASLPAVRDADLVVSDNLVGVLAVRPDAVLEGSFLWSDVLGAAHPGHRAVAAFVDHEQALLAGLRPEMVCVGDLAMPGVQERTRARPVGWMCPPEAPVADEAASVVGVLGGRTGHGGSVLVDDARALVAAGLPVVVQDDLLADVPGAAPFRYDDDGWSRLGAVLARPGVGTLTDCVARRIPVLARAERGNTELAHLARRVAALGLGADLDAVVAAGGSVADSALDVLARRPHIRAVMGAMDHDGIAEAADVLSDRLRAARDDHAAATTPMPERPAEDLRP